MPVEAVAARLAGGFARVVDSETLLEAVSGVMESSAEFGDLQPVRDLPGLPSALASTLLKAWWAGVESGGPLAIDADPVPASLQPRLKTLVRLENAVLARLPPAVSRPADIMRLAQSRLNHAPAVLGDIEIRGLADLAPCWRPLITGLAKVVEVTWIAGPRPVPIWLHDTGVILETSPACSPTQQVYGCANARHEVLEAVRWARRLVAEGQARPEEVAIAAASPAAFDDLMLSAADEAGLDIYFAHGRRALATRPGQAAAALADNLLRGPSQERVRRLDALARDRGTPFGALADADEEGWTKLLPRDAPLDTREDWRRLMVSWEAPEVIGSTLAGIIDLLAQGTSVAAQAGEVLLRGQARAIWRRAVVGSPASAIEQALGRMRTAETVDPAGAIAWMSAATLASCPRRHVRLIGLNSRLWPRQAAEDPLLPDHLVPRAILDPLPITAADRQDFRAILDTTEREVVCSFSRRDAEGRLLGRSPLLTGQNIVQLRRTRIPDHAASEADRLMARPAEFTETLRAASARGCWADWATPSITGHDGLVRPDHPQILQALRRTHSASSLKMLLRNPQAFVWKYALGWKEPSRAARTLELDALSFGSIVHKVLEKALPSVEQLGGLPAVGRRGLEHAVRAVCTEIAAEWERTQPVPPANLWRATLERVVALSVNALAWPLEILPGQRSFGEVVFNNPEAARRIRPWDSALTVRIAGTPLAITGYIDRLDISADGARARVVDYKTGKPWNPGTLNGGAELQRCLYAYVVHALLGEDVEVEAGLLYPAEGGDYWPLADLDDTLARLTRALLLALESLRAGRALPGPESGRDRDELRFALPVSPGTVLPVKKAAAGQLMGDAAQIWSAE